MAPSSLEKLRDANASPLGFSVAFVILVVILVIVGCLALLSFLFVRHYRDGITETAKKETFLNERPTS